MGQLAAKSGPFLPKIHGLLCYDEHSHEFYRFSREITSQANGWPERLMTDLWNHSSERIEFNRIKLN